jgi:hypothetical protein
MSGPSPDVRTGVLRGGPFDGIVIDIEQGAETLQLGAPEVDSGGEPGVRMAELSDYRFSGELDEDGNAVYVPT